MFYDMKCADFYSFLLFFSMLCSDTSDSSCVRTFGRAWDIMLFQQKVDDICVLKTKENVFLLYSYISFLLFCIYITVIFLIIAWNGIFKITVWISRFYIRDTSTCVWCPVLFVFDGNYYIMCLCFLRNECLCCISVT